jgi:hypothetical protein
VQNRKLFAQSRTKPCKSDYFNPTKTHAFPTLSAFFTGDPLEDADENDRKSPDCVGKHPATVGSGIYDPLGAVFSKEAAMDAHHTLGNCRNQITE